jgi:chromosomal replication initiator protein
MTEGNHPNPDTPTDQASPDFWQACIDQLAQELPEQQFQTWIKPLTAQVSDDLSKVTLFVANRFKLDWIRAQYSARLALLMERLTGQAVQIELALAPREIIARSQPTVKPAPPTGIEAPTSAADARPYEPLKSRINTALTFEALVEGSANRMARAAAMHVAGMPGHLVQPAVHLRRRGFGQDPPDACRGQPVAGRPPMPKFSTSTPNSL